MHQKHTETESLISAWAYNSDIRDAVDLYKKIQSNDNWVNHINIYKPSQASRTILSGWLQPFLRLAGIDALKYTFCT